MILWVCGRLHAENTFSRGVSGLEVHRWKMYPLEECTLCLQRSKCIEISLCWSIFHTHWLCGYWQTYLVQQNIYFPVFYFLSWLKALVVGSQNLPCLWSHEPLWRFKPIPEIGTTQNCVSRDQYITLPSPSFSSQRWIQSPPFVLDQKMPWLSRWCHMQLPCVKEMSWK